MKVSPQYLQQDKSWQRYQARTNFVCVIKEVNTDLLGVFKSRVSPLNQWLVWIHFLLNPFTFQALIQHSSLSSQ